MSDVEDEGPRRDQGEQPARRRRMEEARGVPLENLLRLLAGGRVLVRADGGERGEARSNEELVNSLRRAGLIASDAVTRAMMLVPRGAFVPDGYRDEAYIDSPIRVAEQDFNISAPHMHAQMLSALEVQPGDRFLDVGCGCGVLAACAALLAGPSGAVTGVDLKPYCVALSRSNVERLTQSSSEFAATAAPITWRQANIFVPSAALRGAFNKVCVGAACPEDRLHLLLHLLAPGGRLLAPVDSDLRLYTQGADGRLRQRLISSVRFSDLEVPTDAAIALAVLAEEQAALMQVHVSPSTLTQDLPAAGDKGCGSGFMHLVSSCFGPSSAQGRSMASPFSGLAPRADSLPGPETPVQGGAGPLAPGRRGSSPGSEAGRAPGAARRSGSAGSDASMGDEGTSSSSTSLGAAMGLGEPDVLLQGTGWSLRAHKAVLKARSAHFTARLSSGMRDAHDCEHKVPEAFSEACMAGLLAWMYSDELPAGLAPCGVVQLLHAASYYSCARLIELCEARLVAELLALPLGAAAAEAPHLLLLADELGLGQLRRAVVAFTAQHYAAVQASEAWGCLDRRQVEAVASHLAGEMVRLKQLLGELQPPEGMLTSPKRRAWW